MHIRKFLSIFLIGLVFAIAGCNSNSTSGISDAERGSDIDGDGIGDEHDGDIDGDDIPNGNDDDIDGDGILNKDDTDDDGDGTPDATDPTPEGPGDNSPSKKNCEDNGSTWDDVSNQCAPIVGDSRIDVCINSGGIWEFSQCTEEDAREVANPCTSAKIFPANDDYHTGDKNARIKWELQPDRCELSSGQNATIQVTAYHRGAEPTTRYSGNVEVGQEYAGINIPHNCKWPENHPEGGKKKIEYDFSQIGTALGDTAGVAAGRYKQTIPHPHGENVEGCNSPPISDGPAPFCNLENLKNPRTTYDSLKSEMDVSISGTAGSGKPFRIHYNLKPKGCRFSADEDPLPITWEVDVYHFDTLTRFHQFKFEKLIDKGTGYFDSPPLTVCPKVDGESVLVDFDVTGYVPDKGCIERAVQNCSRDNFYLEEQSASSNCD
jgi:hypothetical protein